MKKDVVLDENKYVERIIKKYGQSKNFIVFLIKICKDLNIINYKDEVEDFIVKKCK